jgi:hypothetical protein
MARKKILSNAYEHKYYTVQVHVSRKLRGRRAAGDDVGKGKETTRPALTKNAPYEVIPSAAATSMDELTLDGP